MRRFMMLRRIDETGVSGTGHIADGVLFEDGKVVIRWRTATPGTTLFDSLEHAKAVHGHDGKTVFEFHDDAPSTTEKLVWLCVMCFSDMDIPLNHCHQCGSGGTAVPMSKSQLEAVQRHDQDRLDSLRKKEAELAALRRVALDRYGPTALGLSVDRWKNSEGEEQVSGVRVGRTTHCSKPADGETDLTFMLRVGETAALDPEHVRKVHAETREHHRPENRRDRS